MPKHVAVVTGGAGFLGSHLCERLLGDGYSVIALDNFVTGRPENVAHLLDDPAFDLVECDVSAGMQVVGPVAAVLHFASPASPIDYLKLPIETMKVGSYGTFNALDLARAKGARFLMASTSESYGDPQVHPQVESYWGHVNPVGPRSVYDEAKRFSEAATMAYRREYGLRSTVLRIFNTYGERMRTEDGRVIPAFITQALAGRPLTVAGDGSQTRSVCYVSDLVDGILRALASDIPGPVNLGRPEELSVQQLAELIIAITGSSSPITYIDRPVDDPTVRCPDITYAKSVLGWEPAVPIREGLERTVAWFQQEAAALLDLREPDPVGA